MHKGAYHIHVQHTLPICVQAAWACSNNTSGKWFAHLKWGYFINLWRCYDLYMYFHAPWIQYISTTTMACNMQWEGAKSSLGSQFCSISVLLALLHHDVTIPPTLQFPRRTPLAQNGFHKVLLSQICVWFSAKSHMYHVSCVSASDFRL